MAENTTENLKSTVAKEGVALGLEAEGCPPQLAKPIAGAVVDKAQSSQNDQNAKQSNSKESSQSSEASEGNDRGGMVAMVKEIGKLVANAVDAAQKTAKKASKSLSDSGLDSSDQETVASSPESPGAEADNKSQSNKSKPGMSPS